MDKRTNSDTTGLEGEWRVDRMYNGTGTLAMSCIVRLEGSWVKGKMEGQGKRTNSDNTVLEGEFKKDRIYNGSGVLAMSGGVRLEGTWVEGKMEGQGKRTSSDGTVLEGEWERGKRINGSGVHTHPDGARLEGTWVKGEFKGQGILPNADGSVYSGAFKRSKLTDEVVSDNGNVSVKKRKESVVHGYGKMLFSDGVVYEGMWVNGERHGAGKLVNIDGVVVEGEFRHNKLYNGSGTVVTSSGNTCEETWVKGKMKGTLRSPTGQVLGGPCRCEKVYSKKNLHKTRFLKPTLFAKLTKEACAEVCEKYGLVLRWKNEGFTTEGRCCIKIG